MHKEWKRQGICDESELLETIFENCFHYFTACQTDQFIAGRNTQEMLRRIDTSRLLEIRLFSEDQEVLARRTMIGAKHKFQWRIASEEGLLDNEYVERYQTLDIDRTKINSGSNGNLQLMTTGGGKYELPVSETHDSIRIISYIGYDESGMAYIYDNRLAGFAAQGGKG